MRWSREGEVAAVDRLLEAARAGSGAGLVLRGEPGIGKSTLLGYAREQASGMRVLSATGAEAESTLAYAVLHQLLRPVLRLRSRLPAPQAGALGVALGVELGEAPDRFAVSLATLTLLSEAAGERPLLCILDDAHWADGPSAEVIAFVARRLDTDPIALLVAARSGEGTRLAPAGVHELNLVGFDQASSSAFLEQRWGESLAPEIRDSVVRATRGNPLALTELPGTLTEEQRAGRAPLPDPLPLGDELERMFMHRLASLQPQVRTLALLCAADGSGSIETIRKAATALSIEDPLARLTELGDLLQVDGGTAIFRHPLVRSAVYHAAGPADRRAAHLALAGALDATDVEADRRAWHRAQAALGPDEDTAAELELSAERTQRRSGHAAAAVVLERAADLSPSDGDRSRRLVAAADAAWRGGDTSRARTNLDRAERLGTPETVVGLNLRHLKGVIELRSGIPADGLAILLDAARDAMPLDPSLTFRMLAAAGEAAFQAGDMDAPVVVGRLMADLPDSDDIGHTLLVRLCRVISPIQWTEEPAGLRDDFARIEELDDPDILARAGGMAFGLGEHALARRLRVKAAARARATGAAGILAWTLLQLANDQLSRSQFLWAEASAAEGRDLALETGQPNLACQHQALLTEAAALRGREDEAQRLARHVLPEAAGRGLHGAAAMVRRSLCELALALGRPEEALLQLETMWPLGFTTHRGVALMAIPDLVEAGVRAGRPEVGRERLPDLLAWADSGRSPEARALATRCQALLATAEEADRLYGEALELHAGTDRPLDTARTALLYGEHLRRERRRVDARGPLRTALDSFEALGAAAWAERARTELRATGETARKRDPSTIDRLTQQELQVVRVVSQGVTNREAAAQLFISPRTIDHHLRSVFRKLEIRSRAELVRLSLTGDTVEPSGRA